MMEVDNPPGNGATDETLMALPGSQSGGVVSKISAVAIKLFMSTIYVQYAIFPNTFSPSLFISFH